MAYHPQLRDQSRLHPALRDLPGPVQAEAVRCAEALLNAGWEIDAAAAEGARVAEKTMKKGRGHVAEAGKESFPASDAPSFTPEHS